MNEPFDNKQNTDNQEQEGMQVMMTDNNNETGSNQETVTNGMSGNTEQTMHAGGNTGTVTSNVNGQQPEMHTAREQVQQETVHAENANQQPDSTYHYSYVNQNRNAAQTNENYANGAQQAQQQAQQTEYVTYSNSQTGNASPYRPANYQYQNNTNTGNANAYASTNGYGYQNGKMTQNGAGAQKKKGAGVKVVKFVGGAIAFGAIAGCVMIGMTTAFQKVTGQNTTASNRTIATTTSAKGTQNSSAKGSTSSVVSSVMPSIVSITSTFESSSGNLEDFYYWFYGGNDSGSSEQTGSGSGFIISETDEQLMVVTNNHVISDESYGDAKKVQVTFSDETTVDATVKGTDSDADLAVLVINKSDVSEDTLGKIKIAVLGDSESMNVGDDVIAIGNALGYGQSVTTGVVSALNREVQLTDKTMTLLQTDAAINPGNSGGALLNANGEVIGINTVKYSASEVEGMGYAIPMATAQPIIEELMNEETVPEGEQSYLGIQGDKVDSELAQSYNMPEGVWVSAVVEDSPAAQAGIQKRDIIVKFNDHSIASMESLQEQLAKKKAGTKVTITVQRLDSDGEYKDVELEVTLGKKSEAQGYSNSQQQEQEQQQQQMDPRQNNQGRQNDNGGFFNR